MATKAIEADSASTKITTQYSFRFGFALACAFGSISWFLQYRTIQRIASSQNISFDHIARPSPIPVKDVLGGEKLLNIMEAVVAHDVNMTAELTERKESTVMNTTNASDESKAKNKTQSKVVPKADGTAKSAPQSKMELKTMDKEPSKLIIMNNASHRNESKVENKTQAEVVQKEVKIDKPPQSKPVSETMGKDSSSVTNINTASHRNESKAESRTQAAVAPKEDKIDKSPPQSKPVSETMDKETLKKLWRSTTPIAGEKTIAIERMMYAGFRNQMMAYGMFTMQAVSMNYTQVLLPSLVHKDTYASNFGIKHELLFDVEHYNSYYPKLPRLVHCDPEIHVDFDCKKVRPKVRDPKNPWVNDWKIHHLMNGYFRYTRGKTPWANKNKKLPNPVDKLMLGGALRPNPELQKLIDNFSGGSYMTLHARVEPDMQDHNMCQHLMQKNITSLFKSLENHFKEPPAPTMFISINRDMMEKGADRNPLYQYNLDMLNKASKEGLWGGRVKVLEYGPTAIPKDSDYRFRPSIVGSLINYFLSVDSPTVFIGSQISTYSRDIMASRLYGGNLENYYYQKTGEVVKWSDENTTIAPSFSC